MANWVEYGYDEFGNMIREIFYNKSGELISQREHEYEYDIFGNAEK